MDRIQNHMFKMMNVGKYLSFFVFTIVAAVDGYASDGVRVSSFGGFNTEDSTEIIQKALNSGAGKIVFDRQSGPWVSRPVFVRSNTEIVFEDGVELCAKRGAFRQIKESLLSIECATNVTLRGLGKGGVLRMWKKDYQNPPYRRAQWRHTLNIMSSRNVTVENMRFIASGGDGIYLGVKVRGCANTDVVIRNCVCDDNHRQGISVISAENLLIENVVMKNTSGTAPESGIDFEPNAPDEKLVNCVMRNCISKNNKGAGCDIYLAQLDASSEPVTITLENCRSFSNKRPALPVAFRAKNMERGVPKGGFLKVKGCHFADCPARVLTVNNKPAGTMDVLVEDCVFESGRANSKSDAPVMLMTRHFHMPFSTDGITFKNVEIRCTSFDDWFAASDRPWLSRLPRNINGTVKLVAGGKCKTVNLGEEWCRRRFPDAEKSVNMEQIEFRPGMVGNVVDATPGEMVPLSPVKLRYKVRAWVYVDSEREVSLFLKQFKVSRKRPIVVNPINVFNDRDGKIAVLEGVGEELAHRSFRLPKAGFYRIEFDASSHGMVFSACNVPIGFVPINKKGFVIFQTEAPLYFAGGKRLEAAIFCGGGGGEAAANEVASFELFDPAGDVVHRWENIGDWGFFKLESKLSDGLWKLSVKRPSAGYWEDTCAAITGAPEVFFLSNKKYWICK